MFCDHVWSLFGHFFSTFFITQDKTRPDKTRQDNTRKHDESCGFYHTNSRSTYFSKCVFLFVIFKIVHHLTQKTLPKHDPQTCPKMYHFWTKNGAKMRPLCSGPPALFPPMWPYGCPRVPKDPPRASQGPPKGAQGHPKGSPRAPKGTPRLPFWTPRVPQGSPRLPFWSPKGAQGWPRLPFWTPNDTQGSILVL